MDDGRPAILMTPRNARWRAPRGYVENVAAAIALAATDDRAAGQIYNVADDEAPTEAEAQATIRQMGYFVTRISVKKERKKKAEKTTAKKKNVAPKVRDGKTAI